MIYPKNDSFNKPLEVFEFSPKLRLWAFPYDLENDSSLIDTYSLLFDKFNFELVRDVA